MFDHNKQEQSRVKELEAELVKEVTAKKVAEEANTVAKENILQLETDKTSM
jgi:hypothetical protein